MGSNTVKRKKLYMDERHKGQRRRWVSFWSEEALEFMQERKEQVTFKNVNEETK